MYSWFIWLEKLAKVCNCKVVEIYEWKAAELLNWMEYILNKEAFESLQK